MSQVAAEGALFKWEPGRVLGKYNVIQRPHPTTNVFRPLRLQQQLFPLLPPFSSPLRIMHPFITQLFHYSPQRPHTRLTNRSGGEEGEL